MSSEAVVPRPHYDSRAVAQDVPVKEPPVVGPDVPLPSSGSATAGFRSAKYSPAEWFSNYHSILQQAATNRRHAGSIQRASKALYQDAEAAALQTQAEGTRLLGERLQEIHHWKSELRQHIDRLLAHTQALSALKTRLEKALDATETPYAIATDNLNCRARRPGPDLVRDTVEEELLKEVDLIRSVQALLKRTLAQVVSQIKMNRDAKQMLELDWSDKYQAYNLDDLSGGYSNMSPDTRHHPSSASVQDQVCNSTSWTRFTQDNLSKALQEEQASNSLRSKCTLVQTGVCVGGYVKGSLRHSALLLTALAVCVCVCQAAGGAGAAGHHPRPESPVLQCGPSAESALCGADRGQDPAGGEARTDLGADRGSGEEHRGYTAGHPQQRGSPESSSVQTLPALPQTQHGALQG